MKTITFRNGDPMPLFGLGTYQSKANELHDAIISALKDGYRLIIKMKKSSGLPCKKHSRPDS